ncbi:hypothetical protein [Paraburkholderia sp. BCC1886]|uniref:hypothetical protein n=1 Tax=Paraburkholderia sp. BCC1886 TaxID=2562670 RepID=UPI0011822B7E|nr:hypothetical protein [Paraburkholderia sp. BCC1886]
MLSKETKTRIRFNRMRQQYRLKHPGKYLLISRQLREPSISSWAPLTPIRPYTGFSDFMERGWHRGNVFGVRLGGVPKAVESIHPAPRSALPDPRVWAERFKDLPKDVSVVVIDSYSNFEERGDV